MQLSERHSSGRTGVSANPAGGLLCLYPVHSLVLAASALHSVCYGTIRKSTSNHSNVAVGTCTSGGRFSIRQSGVHAVTVDMSLGASLQYTVVDGRVRIPRGLDPSPASFLYTLLICSMTAHRSRSGLLGVSAMPQPLGTSAHSRPSSIGNIV